MEELESKLNSILSSPERMAQITQLAQSLAGEQGSEENPKISEDPLPSSDILKAISSIGKSLSDNSNDQSNSSEPLLSPDILKIISSIGRSLSDKKSEHEQDQAGSDEPLISPQFIKAISSIGKSLSRNSSKTSAVLTALRPYLDPSRQERLAKAARIAQLARIAKTILPEIGGL